MRLNYIVLCCIVFVQSVYSQEEKQLSRNRDGFYVGVNFGGHIASDAPSQYYNGAPDKPNKVLYYFNNAYEMEDITKYLPNGYKSIAEYPTMKYDPTLCLGGHLGYNFSQRFSVFGEMNLMTLTAKGNLKLEMDKIAANKVDPVVYKSCPISAVEKRADINIGARSMLGQKGWFLPFLEYGINFNIITIKSHDLRISNDAGDTKIVNMLVFYDYPTLLYLSQGGNGYGFFATVGGLINMPSRVHLHVGVQVAAKTTGLTGVTGMNPHATIFIRCNY